MRLKGFSLTGSRVEFGVGDCPIVVADNQLALAGVENSDLLQLDTVVRGNDEGTLFEGDKVLRDGVQIGIVVYSKGFKMQESSLELKTIPDDEHIQLVDGDCTDCKLVQQITERTPIIYGYNGEYKKFNSLLLKSGNHILFYDEAARVDPKNILFYTGYNHPDDESKGIFFGAMFRGGIVRLYNNLPAIDYMGEFELLEDVLS